MTEKDTTPSNAQKDIVDMVGGNGLFQWIIVGVNIVFGMPIAMHNLVMSFYAPNIDHWCARPEGLNWTVEDWKNYGLPSNDYKCSRYDIYNFTNLSTNADFSTRNIVQCDAWEYNETLYGSTLLSKWDLVCDREWLVSMSKSIFVCGFMFSVVFFGYFADRYGRKPIIFLCNIIAVVFSIVSVFCTTFFMFAVCRFFIAVGAAGCFNTAFVLMMETLGPKYRSYYGVAICFGWCGGFSLLPLIVWLLKDWVWVQLILTVPSVLLISSWWLLPESPHWFLTKGKEHEALKVLVAAGKTNGLVLADFHQGLKRAISKTMVKEVKQSYGSILHIIISSGIWKNALIVFYIWFATSFVYYGLSFNTNELAGNPYVNFALSGLIEIPAHVVILFVIGSVGRKGLQGTTLAAAGLACLAMLVLPEDPWWLSVAMSNMGKLFITAAFAILYVYTTEIFPTSVRGVSLGTASMSARIGSVIAPFVRELSHATHPAVPQIIFGIFAVIGGALVVFLPETKNVTVPNTFNDAAAVNRKEEKKLIATDETNL